MAKTRYAACMAHRAEAQVLAGITDAQKAGLKLGRVKGTNHREGYQHKEASKLKITDAVKAFWLENPDKAKERGQKIRGEKHYAWKGGVSKLSLSIRQLPEHRNWSDRVKARDGACTVCGSTENLEAHHITSFADMLREHGVTSRDAARDCLALWDLANGVTLCAAHHYASHGRDFNHVLSYGDVASRTRTCLVCGSPFLLKPSQIAAGHGKYCSRACGVVGKKGSMAGEKNPNYRGGKCKTNCLRCGAGIEVKPAVLKLGGGRFCSRECMNAARRKNLQPAA